MLPGEGNYQNVAASVGGGTICYGAQAWRYLPQDFRMRSTYGVPAGSSLEDWPISYDDLEPAAKRLGLHPFHLPMARNSVPYNGRGPCMRCRWCLGFACEVDAKNGSQNTVIPKTLATGNSELRTRCMAKEILSDDRGRVRGVAYFDENGHLQEQFSDIVVLSCCAIESARLLLNSKTRLFPNGLGNRYDQVGRHFQGHHYTSAAGYFGFDTYDDIGPGANIAICDHNHGTPGLVGGRMLANEFIRLPIHMVDRLPDGTSAWGAGHKRAMRDYHKRTIFVVGPTQEIPVPDTRVTVDPSAKDKWGLPVVRVAGNVHPHTFEIGDVQARRAEAWLREAGAERTSLILNHAELIATGTHQAGTCRMGTDPRASVVSPHCQMHEIDNLFVIDASVHVTNGGFNPVLTIMAVAYFASDALIHGWKGTGYRS